MLAYVISVALYLRIPAQYLVGYLTGASYHADHLVTIGAVVLIAAVGITKGFRGLSLIERLALGTVPALTAALAISLIRLPPAEATTSGRPDQRAGCSDVSPHSRDDLCDIATPFMRDLVPQKHVTEQAAPA